MKVYATEYISFGESSQLVLPRQDALFDYIGLFPYILKWALSIAELSVKSMYSSHDGDQLKTSNVSLKKPIFLRDSKLFFITQTMNFEQ